MDKRFIQGAFVWICLMAVLSIQAQSSDTMKVIKNGVTIEWQHQGDRIYFEVNAPTEGWVAIGFNKSGAMRDLYLIMGRIENGGVEVVEHYTSSPGAYKPITYFGQSSAVENVGGTEGQNTTNIKFSLPHHAFGKYQKDLGQGLNYTMTMAYSVSDDFGHHSRMRTSARIVL